MTADDRVTEIVAEVWDRIDRGEEVDEAALLAAHADVADELRRRLHALGALRHAFGAGVARSGVAPDAAPPEPPSLAGRALGPYRIEAELGAGGMGTVYRATVEGRVPGLAPGAVVALKVVHPHLLAREGYFRRFLREAEVGRRVRHPHVVRTFDADAVPGDGGHVHFLVMEHVEGRTLRALLEELERVPEELCRRIGRDVALALSAIHAAGAVHRDLKPDNVLVTPDHVVKVMDLGVARTDDDLRLSQTGAFVGSVRYAAPEQFGGRDAKVDGRADLYALGLVLFEIATAVHPFAGDDFHATVRRQLSEVPRPAGEVNPQLSPFFEDVVRRLLGKDPAERFASAAELARVLDEGEKGEWWRTRARELRVQSRRPLRRIRIPRETAVHGRDADLARLGACFAKARSGEGQVVLVEGEAGIGKSRLVDEFVARLRQSGEDVEFLYGSYPPGGAATSSGAFSTAFREHFGEEGLEDALREALPQTPLLVPAFAALLRGDAAPVGSEELTKDALQTVFVHAARSLAARRPTIVLIDDLHFAPEEGRALFASLALAVPGHRVLLAGTARPEIDATWLASLDRIGASRIALQRLGAREVGRLLVDAFRSERLAEELGFRIATKSDGNPFFVFEILRGLREGQFLQQQPDGRWVTTQVIRDIQIPSSVLDLVQARVADLAAEERNLLDVASCIGFEFDPALAGAVLGLAEIPALQAFARIEKKHRLVRSAGRRYLFDHHQVQEALYGGLFETLRERYHAAIGAALETQSGALSKEPAALDGALSVDLAEHFLAGGEGRRAVRYLGPALSHLERVHATDRAAEIADRALAVPGLLTERARLDVLLSQASRLDRLGAPHHAKRVLTEAIALADDSGDPAYRARARCKLGGILIAVSDHANALDVLATAIRAAREAADVRGEASALSFRGTALGELGRVAEAEIAFASASALVRESLHQDGDAAVAKPLGRLLMRMGRPREALASFERALAQREDAGSAYSRLVLRLNLAGALVRLCRFSEAERELTRCLETARALGARVSLARVLGDLGCLHYDRGSWAEALSRWEQYAQLAHELCDPQAESIALVNLGCLRTALGDRGAARRDLEASHALTRDTGERYWEAWAIEGLARLDFEEGDEALALRSNGRALAIRREIRDADGVAESLLRLSDLEARAGDRERAVLSCREVLAGRSAELDARQSALALVRLACLGAGPPDAAEAAVEAAGAWLRGIDAAELRFLLWQATRERGHLAEAKRLLDLLVEHAPPEYRESMLVNVRLHREIVAAAREHLPVAGG